MALEFLKMHLYCNGSNNISAASSIVVVCQGSSFEHAFKKCIQLELANTSIMFIAMEVAFTIDGTKKLRFDIDNDLLIFLLSAKNYILNQ